MTSPARAPSAAIVASMREALACHERGDHAGAERGYRRVLARAPEHADALGLLALALLESGRLDEAAPLVERAVQIDPPSPVHLNTLASVRRAQGRAEDALAAIETALRLAPQLFELALAHGIALREVGRHDAARARFQELARTAPPGQQAMLRFHLGVTAEAAGDLDAAELAYREATLLDPGALDAYVNLAGLLARRLRFPEAARVGEAALRLAPTHPGARLNTAGALSALGRMTEALAHLEAVRAAAPHDRRVLKEVATCLIGAGQVDEAVAVMRDALGRDPDDVDTFAGLLFTLNYTATDPDALRSEHERLDALVRRTVGEARAVESAPESGDHAARAGAVSAAPPANAAVDPLMAAATHAVATSRRLRIGYLSPDFRMHSVAFFLAHVLERHDRDRCEVFCYHTHAAEDAMTRRIRAACAHWRSVQHLADAAIAAQIAADRIEVLVDLAGHTSGGRPRVLARRPAPVQMTWLGYPTGTGLAAVGYRISDAEVDPPGGADEDRGAERPLRMPASYFCFEPTGRPALVPPPRERAGRVTFGSFNNIAKISATTVRLWVAVLRAVPESRLLLKARALLDPGTRARLAARFAAEGIDAGRLAMQPWREQVDAHLAAYGEIDVALDTFPYGGATTTCEALWMGVPVVTLSGATHASRMSRSIASAAGLRELVAESETAFVERAAALATGDGLVRWRLGARERLGASPLLDAAAFATALEDLYARAVAAG